MRIPRRNFITLLGGAAVAWPLAARAQKPALPVIGFLGSASLEGYADRVRGFRQGLGQAGFVEDQNVTIEYRWAQDNYERLPMLAAELVRSQPALIVAAGGAGAALAVKATTATMPILFLNGSDPVKLGLVPRLNRPGGNITGVTILTVEMAQKRLEIVRELAPNAELLALLVQPNNPNIETYSREAQGAAHALGRRIEVLRVASESDLDTVFASLPARHIGAVVVSGDPIFLNQRNHIVALATQYAIPTMYAYREFVSDGGLMSYGPNITDAYPQVGIYAAQLLKGAKPAEMPVVEASKSELVINLKTARALGLEVPMSLLMRVDEVVE